MQKEPTQKLNKNLTPSSAALPAGLPAAKTGFSHQLMPRGGRLCALRVGSRRELFQHLIGQTKHSIAIICSIFSNIRIVQ